MLETKPAIKSKLKIYQKEIELAARARGFHLVTSQIEKQLKFLNQITIGTCHLLLKHTSASLTLNENADSTVRDDFKTFFSKLIADETSYFKHNYEGDDDMPAHLKSSLLGTSLTIPISDGQFNLGTWQGIYLGEHRNHGGKRKITATAIGL